MKKLKIGMPAVGAALLALVLTATAGAQQRNNARMGFQIFEARQALRGLRLSETQRAEIRTILETRRPEILEARKALLKARLAIVKEQPGGPEEFGKAQAGAVALRRDILNQIKMKLSPDQLEILQKRQQRQAERIERVLERLEARNGTSGNP